MQLGVKLDPGSAAEGPLRRADRKARPSLRAHGLDLSQKRVSTLMHNTNASEDMNLYEAIKGRRHYLPEQKARTPMDCVAHVTY